MPNGRAIHRSAVFFFCTIFALGGLGNTLTPLHIISAVKSNPSRRGRSPQAVLGTRLSRYLLTKTVRLPVASIDTTTTSFGVYPAALSLADNAVFAITLASMFFIVAMSVIDIFMPAL